MISDNAPNETFKDNIWIQKFGDKAMPKAPDIRAGIRRAA